MKSIMRIIALSIILAFALNLNYTQAKERKHHRKHHKGMHKLTDQQKQILTETKNYLDSRLSEEDLAKLNELRELVKKEKSDMMQEIRAKKQSGADKSEIREYIKSQKEEMRDEKEEVKEALKELADNNSELMQEIGDRLKALRPEIGNYKGKNKKHKDEKKKHFARFLLWDGTFPEKHEIRGMNFENNSSLNVKSNGNSLTVETQENMFGEAYIYDAQGSQVAELGSVKLVEGENTISLSNTSDLNNGTYFFIIKSDNLTQSGKFIYLK